MAYLQLKIETDNKIVKYIKIIREYNKKLSISDIKEKIELNDFVVEYNSNEEDILDNINGIDRKRIFRNLIQKLEETGAKITIYHNNKIISLKFLLFNIWLNFSL